MSDNSLYLSKEKKDNNESKSKTIFPLSKVGGYISGGCAIGLFIYLISLLIVWNLRAIHFFMRSVLIHIIWYLLIGGIGISLFSLFYFWIWVWSADEDLFWRGKIPSKKCRNQIIKALISFYSLLGSLLAMGLLYMGEIYHLYHTKLGYTINEFIGLSILFWITIFCLSFFLHLTFFGYETRFNATRNAKQQKGDDN